ncbi:RanGTP-binding protein-domain-containing protein [Sporodiniella umbellata]|nr:RanGTP-binding protein-domain-containing protein [Sporodiniella umbellata]
MSNLEELFGKIALTTVTTVSRIALGHATNAAIRNVTSYITTQAPNKQQSSEMKFLQRQLDLKVKNLKPTIDIIAKSVAEGNHDLVPALEMCNDLKQDIDEFSQLVETTKEPESIQRRLQKLLSNVDDTVPSLHLALRSIENKAGRLTASPSRLVRASALLSGPKKTFVLKLYSLFTANAKGFTWKEEFRKCQLSVEKQGGWELQLVIQEDVNDGLYHEGEGEKMVVQVDNIQRMYHTQSGELLNIEDLKSSVLVLKVSKKKEESKTESKIETKDSSPEIIQEELRVSNWYAFGLYDDDQSEEEDDDENEEGSKHEPLKKPDPFDLLLLESVIKLGLLESTEQLSHLEASDELINLYMA